jgi:hypothetical protein
MAASVPGRCYTVATQPRQPDGSPARCGVKRHDPQNEGQAGASFLCAFLRMPCQPDPASKKHREGEREV